MDSFISSIEKQNNFIIELEKAFLEISEDQLSKVDIKNVLSNPIEVEEKIKLNFQNSQSADKVIKYLRENLVFLVIVDNLVHELTLKNPEFVIEVIYQYIQNVFKEIKKTSKSDDNIGRADYFDIIAFTIGAKYDFNEEVIRAIIFYAFINSGFGNTKLLNNSTAKKDFQVPLHL